MQEQYIIPIEVDTVGLIVKLCKEPITDELVENKRYFLFHPEVPEKDRFISEDDLDETYDFDMIAEVHIYRNFVEE